MVNEGHKNAHLPLSLAWRPILHRLCLLFLDSTVLPNWFAVSVPFIPFPNGFRRRFVFPGGFAGMLRHPTSASGATGALK